ncbi:MAG: ATP-binding cassette domain-containing protein [Nitrospiraceae bacterium]|nr:ATP-binding cassette domain-containing protein [Nitrospiraceae bacterium]
MISIEAENLTKKFGELTAVDNVNFKVDEGEFFGFLGPNGAGKTTLIRMLTTLLRPSGGRAVVAGWDVVKDQDEVRKSIGVVPQAMTSDLDLTGFENMDIYGRFYGMPRKERLDRIYHLLELVGLSQRAGELVAAYSGGMRRRLEVVKALVHKPKILFLDEPTQGLDPQSRRTVWDFLREFKKQGDLTIYLTTHYMEEAEALCSRVGIVDYGKIIVLDSPANLKARLPEQDTVVLEFRELSEGIMEAASGLELVHGVERENNTLYIKTGNGAHAIPPLLQRISSAGGIVVSVNIREKSLEDVFIHFTGRSIRQEEAKRVSRIIGAGMPSRWTQR